jgi:hypothetical protein
MTTNVTASAWKCLQRCVLGARLIMVFRLT